MKILLTLLSIFTWSSLCHGDTRIHRFVFSNDGKPANYLIPNTKKLVGQSVDMVKKVCKLAGRKCKVGMVDRVDCWDNIKGFPPSSPVLNGRWYDSCANLPRSPERALNYIFPNETFYRTAKQSLLVAQDSTISANDLTQCNDFTVAYPVNTALLPDCLFDLGFSIQKKNYRPVAVDGTLTEIMAVIIEMVKNKTVDMGLAITRFQGGTLRGVKPLNERLSRLECPSQISEGLNVMMRSDDEEFVAWWDKTLHKFICSGQNYNDFCKLMKDKYNADPLCRVPGEDVDCSKFGGPGIKIKKPTITEWTDPCRIRECQNKEISTFKNSFFAVHDHRQDNIREILVGSRKKYKGQLNEPVGITITALDESFFRVDKFCLTVNTVAFLKIVLRGGNRQAEEVNVPVDIEKEWSTYCVRDKGLRNKIRVELDPLERKFAPKDNRIRIENLELTVCLDNE